MPDGPLAGLGVLVTRPVQQSAALARAIEAAGGRAVCFPVIEITPRSHQDVAADAARLARPDIVIFVSRNAVEHGLEWSDGARIAAVGPATAAAIRAAARVVDIVPAGGFDSESLLAEAALADVAGKTIRIIRGNGGRELLAATLRERGAHVDYLEVYSRARPAIDDGEIAALCARWRRGEIGVVTVMSVESLDNLLAMLPKSCRSLLVETPLVTPAARVLKEAGDRLPGCPAMLAAGPGEDEMVRAIATLEPHASGYRS